MSLTINPETKVAAMLDAYPNLEPVLIGLAPAFERLRNPVLRRTVARLTTLEQAARVGGIGLQEMVRRLREAAGLPVSELPVLAAPEAGGCAAGAGWLMSAPVAVHIDADAMLERGVHPVGMVKQSVAALEPGTSVWLTSAFRPEPLIEMMRRGGAEVHSAETSPGRHSTWFGKR